MKLTNETLNVLKNFATINPSIYITEGDVLKTMSTGKTIFAKYKTNQVFENKMAIYDLSRFISSLSLFEDPDLEILKDSVIISSGNNRIEYRFTDPSNIVVPPEKELKLPSTDISFKITNTDLSNILRGLSVLRLPEIAVVGDGSKISLQAIDSKGITLDTYSVTVGNTDKTFKMFFKAENMKIIPGDYDVEITKGISKFKGTNIEYFIAVEANSSF